MVYSGFKSRAIALLVDIVIIVPLGVLHLWLFPVSKAAAVISVLLMPIIYNTYEVGCHWKFGQTVGKMVAGIKVVKLDGTPIGLREALLRSSVNIVLSIAYTIAGTYVIMTWTGEWQGLSATARLDLYTERNPLQPAYDYVSQAWFWSELVVLLMNEKRRALHDFIAGTVVIDLRKKPAALQEPLLLKQK